MKEDTMDSACDRINAAALLLAAPDARQPALACGDQHIGDGDLRSAVALAAAAWLDCEVQPGELVLMPALQDIEHAVAFLGAVWAGAVPMPVASPAQHLARHRDLRVRFVLDLTREGHAQRWRDQVMTLAEWRMYVGLSRAARPVLLPPNAAACWSEARRDGGGARLLAHRFALTPSHRVALTRSSCADRAARTCVPVTGALGMLRVLRAGGTALLGSRAARCVGAAALASEEEVLP
jgi:hypothetical protein